ncbi:COMM domain-containing protein 3 [Anoplophora glabripennis]|uniref:COMM domain-containing protein 3 n=1 Tax=Anoplophora glabripennis TaxID=217634 RepID=UPI0008754078|nr:COMM domain-containing protein 3 [Anoplophora glabripennis]
MKIDDKCKNSLTLGQNTNVISDIVYKKLLENCFNILVGKEAVHSINTLYNSKPDIVKEFYAALLKACAEFVRNNLTKEEIVQFLSQSCNFTQSRANALAEFTDKNRVGVESSLVNISTTLPHLTDVKWKIDYIVKSNVADESEGPIFRVSLIAEEYDVEAECKRLKNVIFTCTSQELQDLVYKLKDAVRHCTTLHHRIL